MTHSAALRITFALSLLIACKAVEVGDRFYDLREYSLSQDLPKILEHRIEPIAISGKSAYIKDALIPASVG